MQTREDVGGRLARFVATRNAAEVWPDVPAAAFRAAQRENARVAARVLQGAPRPVRLEVPPGASPAAIGVAAFAAGIGPLLGQWAEAGVVRVEPDVARVLAQHLDHARARARRGHAFLERQLDLFHRLGIAVILVRGTHTRYRHFPDPATRSAADNHLLVQPGDWERARAALPSLGLVEKTSDEHPDRALWSPAGEHSGHALEYAHRNDPPTLELRRSLHPGLLPGLDRTLPTPAPPAPGTWAEFALPVRVLEPPLLLAYLALHASRYFYATMLARLVEIVLVAQAGFHDANAWPGFAETVHAASLAPYVFPALDLAERLVPGTLPPRVYERLMRAVPPWLVDRVRAYEPGTILEMHPLPERGKSLWDETSDIGPQSSG